MAGLKPRLHVLGAGRAGRAMARVLLGTGRVDMGWVVNRHIDSARSAVAFIGAGTALRTPRPVDGADWLLLGLPDGVLAEVAATAAVDTGRPGLAWHLSGAVSPQVLAPFCCPAAAVHPVRPFSDPLAAASGFAGTWCVAAGDAAAVESLFAALEAAGGRGLRLSESDRGLYHAATVVASNYLVTLTALARDLAAAAGLPARDAARLLADLQSLTLSGLTAAEPAEVLTGPVERGDLAACRNLVAAVDRGSPEHARLFRALGRATVELARSRDPERRDWDELAALFAAPATNPGD